MTDRKTFLKLDQYTIKYGNKKCVVKCPTCQQTRSVSTSDYYKKRLNGLVQCRQCNNPTSRKQFLKTDPQIIECPKTFAKNKPQNIKAKCANCNNIITINVARYYKIKKRDGIWMCYNCKKPELIEKSKNNPIYSNEEYIDIFRQLHKNEEYYNKVHNKATRAKIAQSSTKAWQDEEKRRNHMAHRQTDEFKQRISKWSKNYHLKTQTESLQNRSQNFITKATERHKDKYDYSNVEYTKASEKVLIKCNNCGNQSWQTPLTHLRNGACQHCNVSTGQYELYEFISNYCECELNNRSLIDPYEIDIIVSNIGIEYHGLYYHSYDKTETTEERLRHQRKAIQASKNNITLLQFFDYEWAEKSDIIKSMIKHRLKLSIPINARDLTINKLPYKDAKPFFDTNHISGSRAAKYAVCLMNQKTIMIALSFNIDRNGVLEIIRFASLKYHHVRGGLSRLMKWVRNNFKVSAIFTYANLRYSTGIGYSQSGFKQDSITRPNYFYYKNNIRLSRQQCQKHKLPQLLEYFDPTHTEAQNMFNNGYRRVWDAGHKKYNFQHPTST